MEPLLTHFRYALRTLRKDTGFTLAAVLVLALGIGATTAIFGVVNGIVLRPLPLRDSERLVVVCEQHPRVRGFCVASPSNVRDWAERSRTLEALGVARSWPLMMRAGEEAEGVQGGYAMAGFFDALGIDPLLGRLFEPDEVGAMSPSGSGIGPATPHVAVLSHALWTGRFGGDPEVIGRTLYIDDEPFTVVGVLPASPQVPDLEYVRLWIPFPFDLADPNTRGWRGFIAMGRLAPDATPAQLQAELEMLQAASTEQYPEANRGWDVTARPLRDHIVGDVRPTLMIFLGAVGLVLLIACFNVANLLLVRSARRETEFAVRAAVGASGSRLAGQILVESLLLAVGAGVLGIVLAVWATDLFKALAPAGIPRVDQVGLDVTVLGFALAVTLATSVIFGLGPLVRTGRLNLSRSLQLGRPGVAGRVTGRVRRALVVVEMGMALALLIGAGLLLRTFVRFLDWDPGFRTENLITVSAFAPNAKYTSAAMVGELWRRSEGEVGGLPGVLGASTASAGPLFGGRETGTARLLDVAMSEDAEVPSVRWYDVSPDYFATMGIPLLAGRSLLETDTRDAQPVALINETMARRYWPGSDPVGERIGMFDGEFVLEIVGVVGDVQPIVPGQEPEPEVYWSDRQSPRWGTFFVVRTAGDPAALMDPIRERLNAVEPDLDLGSFRTMSERIDARLVSPRFNAVVIGAFAGVALILAAIGLYGVIAYTIATRTHEIGIRIALGADERRVMKGVVKEGGYLVIIGLILGIAGALAASRLLESVVHGVVTTDPLTYIGTALLLAAIALAACAVPAFRASRVDPVTALRSE